MCKGKGKTSNGYAKNRLYFQDSPNLVGGGYLTFCVSVSKNTIVKIKILIMYFRITTTSFLDLTCWKFWWHNRSAFLGVGSRQTERETSLCNHKFHKACVLVLGDPLRQRYLRFGL